MVEITPIKVGRRVNDGLGDDLRTASTKTNSNFSALQTAFTDIRDAASGAVTASAQSSELSTAAAAAAAAALAGLENKASINHTPVRDRDYIAQATDRQIGFVGVLTASRILFFPNVDTFPLGEIFFVADETGLASETLFISFAPGPGSGDKIGDGSPIGITSPYQGLGFRRGAANLWIRAR